MSSYPPPGPYGSDPNNQPWQSGDPNAPASGAPGMGQPPHNPYGAQNPYGSPDPYGAAPTSGQPNPQNPYGAQQPPQGYGQQPVSGSGYDPSQQAPFGAPPPGFGGPPSNNSHTGLIIGVVAVILLVAVLGVGGFFLLHKGSNSNDKADKSSKKSSHSTSPSGNNNTGKPSTGGSTVSPAGSHYSYKMPSGFGNTAIPPSADIPSARYSTAIAPGGSGSNTDLILVTEATGLDASDPGALEQKAQANLPGSTPDRVTIDGRSSLRLDYFDSSHNAEFYYIYRDLGSNGTLYVACGWTTKESAIKRGCNDIVHSLKIKE